MAGMDYQLIGEMEKEKLALLNTRLSKIKACRGRLELKNPSDYDSGRGFLGHLAAELTRRFKEKAYKKPSEMFEGDYEGVMDALVPADYQPSFLEIVDRLNEFQYSCGWQRRSVRSSSYLPWMEQMGSVLDSYLDLFLFPDLKLPQLLLGDVQSEKQSCYLRMRFYERMDTLLAGELDLGRPEVLEAVRDILTSENNTGIVSVGLIRGIMKSRCRELHRLLGDVLLAARLQEGLRQAICENMDCGTADAFLTLFQVIEEHGLIRYSAIRRAVCTWIGIFEEGNVERLTDKMMALMGRALRDPQVRKDLQQTEDAVSISCGLWAEGFYDVRCAMDSIQNMVEQGSRHQKMVVSYYNRSLGFPAFEEEAARLVLMREAADLELTACFLPSFLPNLSSAVEDAFEKDKENANVWTRHIRVPKDCPVTRYFKDGEEAKRFFEILLSVYENIPKKGLEYNPCIFPWYSVAMTRSDLIVKLCFIAYLLKEEAYLDKACGMLGEITSSTYGSSRSRMVNLLLYNPQNACQQEMLVGFVGNAESDTAARAYEMVQRLVLTENDYLALEDMMKSKRSELRARAEKLLMDQEDELLKATVSRLLNSGSEESRSGALDIVMELKKSPKRKLLFEETSSMAEAMTGITGKEQILLDEILGKGTDREEILNQKGYGLYDPSLSIPLKEVKVDKKAVKSYLSLKEDELIAIICKLDQLVDAHKLDEYQDEGGNICLIGNELHTLSGNRYSYYNTGLDQLPLEAVWKTFYETQVKTHENMIQITVYLQCRSNAGWYGLGQDVIKSLVGRGLIIKSMPYALKEFTVNYWPQLQIILRMMEYSSSDRKNCFDMAVNLTGALFGLLTADNCTITETRGYYKHTARITTHPAIAAICRNLNNWDSDEEFEKAFYLKWRMEELFAKAADTRKTGQIHAGYGDRPDLSLYYFIRALSIGLITENQLYQAVFEYFELNKALAAISSVRKMKAEGTPVKRRDVLHLLGEYQAVKGLQDEIMDQNDPEFQILDRMYEALIPMILEVELKRGDSATIFSPYIKSIRYISGADLFVRILTALGRDTLDRDTYYYSYYSSGSGLAKKSSLSHLLGVVYPSGPDEGPRLAELLKGSDIDEKRLVEAAMYAPSWIDLIEDYLGWKGMKSGCYYFMAHMNESFDDKKKAVIAKYTPIPTEELQDGAFDINWFWEAYEQLGETHFKQLYDSAKYISDGSKHSRARKYADAARGIAGVQKVKAEISEKRNKDLLMSYAIIPLREGEKEQDLLERYEYLQQFIKESRQFGAQRRSSEARAAAIAMQNLSINAGYQDVTRLTLNMESRLVEAYGACFQWKEIGDGEYRIFVDEDGKSTVQVQKAGKLLKSIPAKYKKDEYVLMLQGVNKKLKDQYSRTKKMMEESMEDRSVFTAGEIGFLSTNPVAAPILKRLIWLCDGKLGFIRDGILNGVQGESQPLEQNASVSVAHPVDFYQAGIWHEIQQYLFEHEIVQPFKQVFRELYVKLAEERPQYHSLLFAGNQIQPGKTVACLRSRRWVADYDDGLQKVYYKENIVARIYALADWFSPSDVEAPTLEWVEFTDRKDFHGLRIEEIPDIVYSEVMRDVDLAVSVAHVGGVDPETSHSTIEMRKTIVEFNLPLFKLTNVRLEGSHAIIQGTRGEYTVHLGSGAVHQMGGSMIAVLPVHSQKRGKLFLPFVDEDPKTAELMSKIVLFAEDQKIKDPYIMDQIR